MKGFTYLPNVVSLEINAETCVGCGICPTVCPHRILEMKNSKAIVARRDECMECGACALNCPVRAISVDAGVGCASGMINQWLAGFNIRLKNDNSCC
jgi:ferredoxin